MNPKRKIRIFLAFAIGCWLVIAVWAMITHQQGSGVNPIYETIHGDIYTSNDSISIYQGEPSALFENPIGVILPNLQNNPQGAAKGMASLKTNGDIKALVVVAFSENCGKQPLTGLLGWQTPYGVVMTDKGRVDTLKDLGAKTDDEALDSSIDMGSVMFYCAYYFQGVPVVPILLDSAMSGEEITAALKDYDAILSDAAVVVVSPNIKNGEALFTQDLSVLNDTLSGIATTDYSGIFPQESLGALKAFDALLPDGNMVAVDVCNSKEDGLPETFSDLLIYGF